MLKECTGIAETEASGVLARVRRMLENDSTSDNAPTAPSPRGEGTARGPLSNWCNRRRFRLALEFDGAVVGLATDSIRIADLIVRRFGYIGGMARPSDSPHWILIESNATQFSVSSATGLIRLGNENELDAYLLHEIVECAIRQFSPLIVLHAGAVARAGVGIVLMAPSGAGKTTLTGVLARSGFEYLGDDVVPIAADDYAVIPVPMPLCAKAGSWPLLDPDNRTATAIRLGRDTRYIVPETSSTAKLRAYVVVCPRYQSDLGAAELRPLGTVEKLQTLVASESLRTPGLDCARLARIVEWMGTVEAWSMDYGDTDSAVETIARLAERRGSTGASR
ncbi:MAG: hypothetical protein M5U09_19965 [Gammaproteobacteria bacterium]|nr:hypothetical protein [Gammaproteobacteria bacterium]